MKNLKSSAFISSTTTTSTTPAHTAASEIAVAAAYPTSKTGTCSTPG
jgi:hypothetical protein